MTVDGESGPKYASTASQSLKTCCKARLSAVHNPYRCLYAIRAMLLRQAVRTSITRLKNKHVFPLEKNMCVTLEVNTARKQKQLYDKLLSVQIHTITRKNFFVSTFVFIFVVVVVISGCVVVLRGGCRLLTFAQRFPIVDVFLSWKFRKKFQQQSM